MNELEKRVAKLEERVSQLTSFERHYERKHKSLHNYIDEVTNTIGEYIEKSDKHHEIEKRISKIFIYVISCSMFLNFIGATWALYALQSATMK